MQRTRLKKVLVKNYMTTARPAFQATIETVLDIISDEISNGNPDDLPEDFKELSETMLSEMIEKFLTNHGEEIADEMLNEMTESEVRFMNNFYEHPMTANIIEITQNIVIRNASTYNKETKDFMGEMESEMITLYTTHKTS